MWISTMFSEMNIKIKIRKNKTVQAVRAISKTYQSTI